MKKYSVLVIDDQANWRDLLVDLLNDQFDVKSVKDYEGALDAIQGQKPPFHVVITDMRLKDEEVGNEDGLKLIKYLNKRGDETKTIVITGYATLDTAKRALSALSAYDYLEKRPSDGSPFNIQEFQRIVYRAAKDAEEKRLGGFSDISYTALVLEPDKLQRSKLENILRKDGYQVTAMEDVENLPYKDYVLILVNESIITDVVFEKLAHLYPKGKIIILTLQDVGRIMSAMREYPILTAFAMPNGQLNDKDLRDIIRKVLPKKYISARINHPDQPEQDITKGIVGQTYHVNLSIQDSPSENSVGFYLAPQGSKKGKIKLHLTVQAKGIKVEPETERYWDIPLSTERPQPCHFSITPENTGRKDIIIEIDQENRWMGRIQMKVNIVVDFSGENQ
jgi:DNA-binding NtrC family response regulator